MMAIFRKDKNNVVWNFLRKSKIMKQLLHVFLLWSVFQNCEASEECDFIKCFASVKSFITGLRTPKAAFVCKNLLSSSWCSEYCVQHYFPNIPWHLYLNHKSFTKYCNENIANSNANWSCIASHSFRLLTCLANVSSLTTNNVREDMMRTESCRKSFEFQSCPAEILLSECGEKSVDIVKGILQFISNNVLHSCKETDKRGMLSMPVHYHLGYEFMEAANSIDYYYNFVSACFDTNMQDETDLYAFLCGENDYLGSCINFELSLRVKPPVAVRRLLLKYFLLGDIKCKESESVLKQISASTEMKSTSNKGDSVKQNILNDKNDNIFILPETSTQNFKDIYEDLNHKDFSVSTKTPVDKSVVESFTIGKTVPPILVKTEENNNHHHVKNSSEIQPSYYNIHHFKASEASYLCCDRILFVLLFIVLIIFP